MVQLKPSYAMLVLLSAAFLQCGGGQATQKPAAPEESAATPPPAEPTPEPAAGAGEQAPAEPAAEATPEAPKPQPLTDEQSAMVAETANTAEIDQAKLAQKKAKHPRVKKFAGMMIADHSKAKNKLKQIVTKAKITAADNTVATTLKSDTSSATDRMKGLTGPEFDKAYMDAQVDAHKKLLDALDTQMIPNAKNEDLKKFLEDVRSSVETHLKEAQDVQGVVAAAATEAATKAEKPAATKPAATKPATKPATK